MARKSADPDTRLKIYLAARQIARRDDVVNAEDLSKILKMTWRNLRLIIDTDPAFPIKKRGAEGHAWEFQVVKVLDHLIKRCRSEIETNAAKMRRLAELAGVTVPDGAEGMSISELREINRLQIETQRRKMDQGEWIRAKEVRSLITGFFTAVQSEHQATVASIDPAGRLSPEVRADVADHMRGILVRLHKRFGDLIVHDVGPAGRAGARAPRARSRGALRQRP